MRLNRSILVQVATLAAYAVVCHGQQFFVDVLDADGVRISRTFGDDGDPVTVSDGR